MNDAERPRDEGTDAGNSTAAEAAELKQPRKKHGDALTTGTGTRHGVQNREDRPNLTDPEGEETTKS
jgi:hypothetical protein